MPAAPAQPSAIDTAQGPRRRGATLPRRQITVARRPCETDSLTPDLADERDEETQAGLDL